MHRILLPLLLFALAAPAKVSLTALTVEGRHAPLGLDEPAPRLGWQIVSDRRDVAQTAYEIIVASTPEAARRGHGDVWQSGRVASAQSQWVDYGGPALRPGTAYYWRARACTTAGRTPWSAVAVWTTGLLADDNWRGQWIGTDALCPSDRMAKHSALAARYLRKEFAAADKPVRRATVHVCAAGLYTLHINGQRVGGDVLTPVPTDYRRTLAYNTYDVTGLIRRRNAVAATVEAGYHFAVRFKADGEAGNAHTHFGTPRLRLNLIVEYADGTADTLATDRTWRLSTAGPVRKANLYDGETYDARRSLGAWTQPGYDDTAWPHADTLAAPGGRLRGQLTPAMHVFATDSPAAVRRCGGHTLIDFGTNGAGRVRLRVQGRRGHVVSLRYAETLAPGDTALYMANMRTAECIDTIICGDGPVDWTSEFVWHGFRYVELRGMDAPEGMVRELIADRMDDAHNTLTLHGDSRAETLNAILRAARRTIRADFKGMPLDCPQRDERMPWLGDRTAGCTGESYMLDVRALYAKWLGDIADCQRPDGALSDVAPAFWRLYRDNVSWPAALPFAAEMLQRQYGDTRPMRQAYPVVARWLDRITRVNRRDSLCIHGRYGDWCVPPESPTLVFSKDSTRMTDDALINSLYFAHVCGMMARWAAGCGHAADAPKWQRLATETAEAVNRRWLRDGHYANNTITANVLPLAMGLVPDTARAAVERNFVALVEQNGAHVACGVIGMQWLMRALADAGRDDLAWRLATQTDYPSWGYMIGRGATTIWELWNGDTAAPAMNSACHVMLLGDLVAWAYERVGGISAAAPGFKALRLAPAFHLAGLTGCDTEHATPYGPCRSTWRREADGSTTWTVCVPPNTTATLRLGDGTERKVGAGTHTLRW